MSDSARFGPAYRAGGLAGIRITQFVAVGLTATLAVLSLVGWRTGWIVLAGGSALLRPMVPGTATVLLTLSAIMAFRLRNDPPRGHFWVLAAVGLVCVFLALEMADIYSGLAVAPDRLLVKGATGLGAPAPVRISPVTAIGALGIAIAVTVLDSRSRLLRTLATNLSLLVALGGFILLLGYSFGTPFLYGGDNLYAVSVPAALGLLLLGFAVAALGVDCWPFVLFEGDSVQASLMRVVVPIAILPIFAVVLVDALIFDVVQNAVLVTAMLIIVFAAVVLTVLRAATKTGDRLQRAQLLLRSSLESQKDTILYSVDHEYRYLFFNQAHADAMVAAYGTTPKVGRSVLELITSDGDRREAENNFKRALKGESHSNVRVYDTEQKTYFECFFNPIRDEGGSVIGATALARDVTERKLAEDELARQATIDELTGVSNRREFMASATREMKRARRYGEPLAVAFVDVDYLKQVNDTSGHAAGDAALRAFVTACRGTMREIDLIARIGGDEFALLLPTTACEAAALTLERIRAAVEMLSIQTEQGAVSFTVSVGVSDMSDDHESLDELLNRADRALYRAKEAGRNVVMSDCGAERQRVSAPELDAAPRREPSRVPSP